MKTGYTKIDREWTSGDTVELVLDEGVLVKCTGTTKPTFIALANAVAGDSCPVGRVESNQVYEVAAPGTLVVGEKYQIDADGVGITTTTAGVAEVVYADANIALVRF